MSTRTTGHLIIEPALNWAEIRKATLALQKHVEKNGYGSVHSKREIAKATPDELKELLNFGLDIESVKRATEEGDLLVKTAGTISYWSSDGGPSHMAEAVLVEIVAKAVPGHHISGVLISVNEEYYTASKIIVKDNKVEGVSGEIRIDWADGTTKLLKEI